MTVKHFDTTSTTPGVLALLFISAIIPCFGQLPNPPQKAPSKVVAEFWDIETNGERLTLAGWNETSRLFIRSGSFPGNKTINVIRNGRTDAIEETARTSTWAEISITTDRLGQIDSLLRYTPSQTRGPGGVTLLKGPVVTFDLVLAERQWKLNHDGRRALESVVPLQWLISCGEDTAWINKEEAVRYVQQLRDKTTDPFVRKNATETLQALEAVK